MGIFRKQSEEERKEYDIIYAEYVAFLKDEWTPALRSLGLIPPYDTISAYDFDNARNSALLTKMMHINYDVYDKMGTKFIRLRSRITEVGGTLKG